MLKGVYVSIDDTTNNILVTRPAWMAWHLHVSGCGLF
jgi:hypothetical protein